MGNDSRKTKAYARLAHWLSVSAASRSRLSRKAAFESPALLGGLLLAPVLLSAVVVCGSPPQPIAARHERFDWATGAPSVSPKYTQEEAARLALCPPIGAAVFVAAHSKEKGTPLAEVEAELATHSSRDDVKEMLRLFIEQTHRDEYTDAVKYTQSNHEQCVEKVGGLSGARATRAVFCLGRQLVALASYRLRGQSSSAELSAKLQGVPGYTKQAVEFGHAGNAPSTEGWEFCIDQAAPVRAVGKKQHMDSKPINDLKVQLLEGMRGFMEAVAADGIEPDYTEADIAECEVILDAYLAKVRTAREGDVVFVMAAVKEAVVALNELSERCESLIETEQRELIAELIIQAAAAVGVGDGEDLTEEWRQW